MSSAGAGIQWDGACRTHLRMLPHDVPFFWGEFTSFLEDVVGDAHFADVV